MKQDILFTAILAVLAPAPQLAGSSWNIETLDSGPSMANWLSVDLNAAGLPIIAYNVGGFDNPVLRIASFNGLNWTLQNAVPGGLGVSFKVSPSGALSASHVAGATWEQWQDGSLYFATKNKKSWANTLIDRGDVVSTQTSLVYNHAGEPGISYFKGGNGAGLWFARRSGPRWSTQCIDSDAENRLVYNQAVVNAVGNTLIVYCGYDRLKIAQSTDSGGWTISSIPNCQAMWPSIAINPITGQPAIACRRNELELHYFHWNGLEWRGPEILDPGKNRRPSLDFDQNGDAVISYVSGEDVRVARRDYATGNWTIEIVALIGGGVFPSSLKVGSDGLSVIAYQNVLSQTGPSTLEVATQTSP